MTQWSAEQIGNARSIITACRAEGVQTDAQIIAVMTAIQESSLINVNYGDRPASMGGQMSSSRGLFQQLAAWGPLADRMDPAKATRMFLRGGAAGQRGLLDVPGWYNLPPGVACQAVQGSDFPDAYQAHYDDAVALVNTYGTPNPQGGQMVSQNSWPSYTDYGNPALLSNQQSTVPGTSVQIQGGVRAGDAATILLEVARRFHQAVEPLVQSQGCWGFEPRAIRGSTAVSNHASGTAIDLNSARHALGDDPANTFSAAQIDAIHAITAAMGGVVRWGGDYSGRKDGMHFEINVAPDDSRLAQLADRIRGAHTHTTTTTTTTTTPEPPTPAPSTPVRADTGVLDMDEQQLRKVIREEVHAEIQTQLLNTNIVGTKGGGWTIPVTIRKIAEKVGVPLT